MPNQTPSERPLPPRPLYETLPRAVEAYLLFGNQRRPVLEQWARSYRCTVEQVEAEFTKQSLKPCGEVTDK